MNHETVPSRHLSYDLLKEITDGFSEERMLGSGGYGKVYMGMHKDGKKIAIKLLYDMPGLDDEQFLREFNNLASLQHHNIVRLVGHCHETQKECVQYNGRLVVADRIYRALCFDYMHNKSLHENLFDEYNGHDWHTRYGIIKGICDGLKYLHEDLNPPMYHLDLKPANILLDENMVVKIADFGLSKLFGEEQTRITKSTIGTCGYLPPEYIEKGLLSKKFDIFSLGVVTIKIMTGPMGYSKSAEMSPQEFIELVHANWRNRLQATPAPVCVLELYSQQVKICIEIALRCVNADRRERPSIGGIINELNKAEIMIHKLPQLNDPVSLADQGSHGDGDKGEKPMVEDSSLVGRESLMNQLLQYTAKARINSRLVMSVWGMVGVGKSALIKKLYDDTMRDRTLFTEYCWVDIPHPFSLRNFFRSIPSDFHFAESGWLIILDDIQSKKEWDLIQACLEIPRSSKSVIIAITTEASIAAYCANSKELVFNVKGLEAAAALTLFNKVYRKKSSDAKALQNIHVEELILKCGGLPKVIIAIAGVLAEQTVTRMDAVVSLNRRFMHHLETKPDYDSLRGLFGWMHSYFRTCPDSLKPCIFYLSIFPRDHPVRRRRIVRRWIAEGYSRDGDEESAEENGERQFSELLDLSIIQHLQHLVTNALDTRMVLCQVNGFIREYFSLRREEENLTFELGANCALTTQRTGRHLMILHDWNRDRIVFESMDFLRLRSLTVFGKWESFFISENMKLLRVLDLEDASGLVYEDLENIVKWLRRLKFLSLRGRCEIHHLPGNMDHLRQLQTLDVRGTSIVTLPENITKLQKLQYIRAGTNDIPASTSPSTSSWLPKICRCHHIVGVEVPTGIGKLTALHTLGVVNVAASGGKAMVEAFKKLTQLRKLGVSGINRKNIKEFFSAIKGHVHLESLSVRLDKDNQGCCLDDQISLPWKNLRSLKLYGLQDRLPLPSGLEYQQVLSDWFSKLTKMDLEMVTLNEQDIKFLGMVPKLCILRLRIKQPSGPSLNFIKIDASVLAAYNKVKILEIGCSSSSLSVEFGSETMKNLELLKLDCSSGTTYALDGLDFLSELKEVSLIGSNDGTFKTELMNKLGKHPKKPVLKMEELPLSS